MFLKVCILLYLFKGFKDSHNQIYIYLIKIILPLKMQINQYNYTSFEEEMKQHLILEKEMLKSEEVEDKYGKLQPSNLRFFFTFLP